MRYWAALTAYEDSNEHCPVFVALASYAAFVDAGLKAGKGDDALDMMAYLKKTCEPEQFKMLLYYKKKGQILMLCDGLDECSHVKEPIQRYIAGVLQSQMARTVVSSRLAGFSDDFFADHEFQFVQLELYTAETQKLTAKRRMTSEEHSRFCQLLTDQPVLSAYATTPLTLSLLIQLFKSKQLQDAEASVGMNRGMLYESGVLHMLSFKKEQTEVAQPDKYQPVGREFKGEVWSFLEVLALELHTRGNRDFTAADVDRLGYGDLWAKLEPHIVTYSIPVLMRLEVDLTTAAITRSASPTSSSNTSTAEVPRYMFRFIHLTVSSIRLTAHPADTLSHVVRTLAHYGAYSGTVSRVLRRASAAVTP